MALFVEPVTTYWLSEDTSQHRMCADSSTWREREATEEQHAGCFRRHTGLFSRLHVDLRLGPEARLDSGLKVEPRSSQGLEPSSPLMYSMALGAISEVSPALSLGPHHLGSGVCELQVPGFVHPSTQYLKQSMQRRCSYAADRLIHCGHKIAPWQRKDRWRGQRPRLPSSPSSAPNETREGTTRSLPQLPPSIKLRDMTQTIPSSACSLLPHPESPGESH